MQTNEPALRLLWRAREGKSKHRLVWHRSKGNLRYARKKPGQFLQSLDFLDTPVTHTKKGGGEEKRRGTILGSLDRCSPVFLQTFMASNSSKIAVASYTASCLHTWFECINKLTGKTTRYSPICFLTRFAAICFQGVGGTCLGVRAFKVP